jgi:hypothetical protein
MKATAPRSCFIGPLGESLSEVLGHLEWDSVTGAISPHQQLDVRSLIRIASPTPTPAAGSDMSGAGGAEKRTPRHFPENSG